MADGTTFDFVCDELERESSLERLEARGTVRIAVKRAGLDPDTATPEELAVVVERVLPGELTARGVDGGDALCAALAKRVAARDGGVERDTPESIFARLGSR
ncbi:MAG: hypothetical protein ACE5FL_08585 [Myxococcota bacterium]